MNFLHEGNVHFVDEEYTKAVEVCNQHSIIDDIYVEI